MSSEGTQKVRLSSTCTVSGTGASERAQAQKSNSIVVTEGSNILKLDASLILFRVSHATRGHSLQCLSASLAADTDGFKERGIFDGKSLESV